MGKFFNSPHICYDVANKYIAHGALTNSKRESSFVPGCYPTHFYKGQGCFVYDLEEKRYIDYLGGLGSNLFGYNNTKLTVAMQEALLDGCSLSLGTPREAYFAMKIRDKFPHMDKIRIVKSGSEGCSAAIRIARAYTGKLDIVSEGYHGWHDQFTYLTPPAKGVAPNGHIRKLSDGDFDFRGVAGVIIEPVVLDCSAERRAFLESLREACTRSGTVLIFDETITAYRFPKNSVAGYWGIEPDITIQGKALANGMPISVVGGKAKIMDCDYFVSSTFAGEQITLAAAIKCIELVSDEYTPERLWESGSDFLEKFNAAVESLGIFIEGYPTRGAFRGNKKTLALFFQECIQAGIFFHPQTWFYCQDAHPYAEQVALAAQNICRKITDGKVYLRGELPKQPYAR